MEAFAPADTPAQYAPDRAIDIEHADIAVFPDLVGQRVTGVVRYRARVLEPGATEITLHGVGLQIASASVNGQKVGSRVVGEEIRIELPKTPAPELIVAIEWTAEPELGLYFFGPGSEPAREQALREGDEAPPNRGIPERRLALQAWTQGEMHETRHWLPIWDYPNDRFSTSWRIVAPTELAVLANGEAKGNGPIDASSAANEFGGPLAAAIAEHDGALKIWRYEQAGDHVSYLLSVVIGRFEVVRETWRGKPVEYWVPLGQADEARATFSETPAMLDFYSDWIGVEFPWAKYAQSSVQEFTFGGMENVSATTMTDRILHPERLEPIADRQGLVAHELAHQWWGDLVTCREWAHAWLNEGFATYFGAMWDEHSGGEDEFALTRHEMATSYFGEARRYRRAIVTHEFRDASQMFDRHTYPKGGWVLHMLRRELGDHQFQASIQRYAKDNAHALVETADLQRAIREQTGRNLDEFFGQWVFGAGHPELRSSWRFDPSTETVNLTLAQAQPALFEFPLELELVAATGEVVRHRVRVDQRSVQIVLPAKHAPAFVLVDAGLHLLAELDQVQTEAQWLAQLHGAARAIDRLRAAQALAKLGSNPAIVDGLRKAAADDRFHGVRVAAASSLGQIADIDAQSALLELWASEQTRLETNGSDPRARVAVLTALAATKPSLGPDAFAVIEHALEHDPIDHVRAAAATALAKFDGSLDALPARLGGDLKDRRADDKLRRQASKLRDKAIRALRRALEQRSFHEEVEQAAALALGQIGEPKQFDALLDLLDLRYPTGLRIAAFDALVRMHAREGVLGPEQRAELARVIPALLEDPNMRVRRAVMDDVSKFPGARDLLKRAIARELDGRVRTLAEDELRAAP